MRDPGLSPGWRVVALREVDETPHPPLNPAAAILMVAIPETCLPGEGMLCSGTTAFVDVAPVRFCQRRQSAAAQRSGLLHGMSWKAF
jgi:hypothetical protein